MFISIKFRIFVLFSNWSPNSRYIKSVIVLEVCLYNTNTLQFFLIIYGTLVYICDKYIVLIYNGLTYTNNYVVLIEFIIVQSSITANTCLTLWGFNSCGKGISSSFSNSITSNLAGLIFWFEVIISKALSIFVICFCYSNIVLIWLILNPFCNDLIITSFSVCVKPGEANTILLKSK